MKLEQFNMHFPGQGESILVLARSESGEILGTISLRRPGAACGEFARLFVREGVRRQGIGRALVERVAEIARKSGCSALSCGVNPENKRARLFYQRLGFSTAFHFSDGDILMTRPLPPADSAPNGGAS